MCPDQRIVVSGELPMYCIQNQTVCRLVILLLLGEAYEAVRRTQVDDRICVDSLPRTSPFKPVIGSHGVRVTSAL